MKILFPILLALALVCGQANAAPEIVLGDSIALGVKNAGHLPGGAVVGASPRSVAHMVGTYPADQFKGAVVILSCGVSNNPDQIGYCLADLKYLTERGARVILLGVGDALPNSVQINIVLGKFADAFPSKVMFLYGWPDIHPSNYGALLDFIYDKECLFFKICPA